jgi:DNA repair protein RadB
MITLPPPLDSLMGKIETKAITNFCGGPGTGKTNLCLLAALKCASSGGTVTYLDTEGGFSFERLSQLQPNYKLLLSKINLLEPKDFTEQGRMIRELQGTDLVVVDSLSALYRLEYADSGQQKSREVNVQIMEANRELSRQLSILSNFARKNDIPVIVTSHTFRKWDTGSDEIVGGDSAKYWSKAIIFLEKTGKAGERRAVLVKHRSLPEKREAKFLIVQDGIKPSGFKLF